MRRRSEKKVINFDAYEEGAVIKGLNKIRNEQLEKDECTEFVSDLMLRIIQAPVKKVRSRDESR